MREYREGTGQSQIDFANSVEMSPRYLGSLERGDANVTLDVLVRIADGLGVQPSDLLPERARTRPLSVRGVARPRSK